MLHKQWRANLLADLEVAARHKPINILQVVHFGLRLAHHLELDRDITTRVSRTLSFVLPAEPPFVSIAQEASACLNHENDNLRGFARLFESVVMDYQISDLALRCQSLATAKNQKVASHFAGYLVSSQTLQDLSLDLDLYEPALEVMIFLFYLTQAISEIKGEDFSKTVPIINAWLKQWVSHQPLISLHELSCKFGDVNGTLAYCEGNGPYARELLILLLAIKPQVPMNHILRHEKRLNQVLKNAGLVEYNAIPTYSEFANVVVI
jgi:hypothetical protein